MDFVASFNKDFATKGTSAQGYTDVKDVGLQTMVNSSVNSNKGPLHLVPFNWFVGPKIPTSPVNVVVLYEFLKDHPDRNLVEFLVNGFVHGFSIGFKGVVTPGKFKNLKSASEERDGVATAILKELNRGHTMGPFERPPFAPWHLSPIGEVPKPDGSIRLILDLSQHMMAFQKKSIR